MKKKILEFFTQKGFPKLDQPNSSGLYTGVTLDYIHKYVLNNKFKRNSIINFLIECVSEEKITCLYCGDINALVFETPNATPHWSYNINSKYYKWSNFLLKMNNLRE